MFDYMADLIFNEMVANSYKKLFGLWLGYGNKKLAMRLKHEEVHPRKRIGHKTT